MPKWNWKHSEITLGTQFRCSSRVIKCGQARCQKNVLLVLVYDVIKDSVAWNLPILPCTFLCTTKNMPPPKRWVAKKVAKRDRTNSIYRRPLALARHDGGPSLRVQNLLKFLSTLKRRSHSQYKYPHKEVNIFWVERRTMASRLLLWEREFSLKWYFNNRDFLCFFCEMCWHKIICNIYVPWEYVCFLRLFEPDFFRLKNEIKPQFIRQNVS